MVAQNENRTIKFRLLNGEEAEGIFTYDPKSHGNCHLSLQLADRIFEATEPDYFEALCTIRKSLEREGIETLCYGASKTVFPSAMARDMGSGLVAYKNTMGLHARQEDLVHIFDSGDDVEPATVAEQRAFFHNWVKSARRHA